MGADGEPLSGTRVVDASGGHRMKTSAKRWRLALMWLLRLLSGVWMAKGLLAWAVIFGVAPETGPPFEQRLLSFQAITVYFAVIDLVAAVGLWLMSTWGGVLWLLATISQLLLGFFFPRLLPMTTAFSVGYLVLILAYFVATWAAENESA